MYKISGFADDLIRDINKKQALQMKNKNVDTIDPSISIVLEKIHEDQNLIN